MRVVYRMRGLLGDATEDMVNSLDSGRGLLKNSDHRQSPFTVSLNILLLHEVDDDAVIWLESTVTAALVK